MSVVFTCARLSNSARKQSIRQHAHIAKLVLFHCWLRFNGLKYFFFKQQCLKMCANNTFSWRLMHCISTFLYSKALHCQRQNLKALEYMFYYLLLMLTMTDVYILGKCFLCLLSYLSSFAETMTSKYHVEGKLPHHGDAHINEAVSCLLQ